MKMRLGGFLFFFFFFERIPVNDKYKIHKSFERELQALGGTNLLNYFKEFSNKGSRTHEGEVKSIDLFLFNRISCFYSR